jgi:hypothetical protein
METSYLISFLAILISGLSALYARHAVKEAMRSNEIAIHNERLRIFKGILELRGELSRHGVNIKEHDLFGYYENVQLSEFYYNETIHKKIKEYFDTAWEVVKQHDLWEAAESKEDRDKLVAKTYEILKESRQQVEKLEAQMKEHLRLIKS